MSSPDSLPDAVSPPRARDLGVPLDGTPGPYNALTDVPGVAVGQVTLISGDGPLRVGEGPVRTGVTAILPRGRDAETPVYAGWHSLNGNGEMTGTAWIEESGLLDGPVVLTNTHSVGVARDAVIACQVRRGRRAADWSLPVVAETWDGWLNDINGFHVRPEHIWQALDAADSGPVAEGSVGGGTGMICHGYKGGIGTASRVVITGGDGAALPPLPYTVSALVQANYGLRRQLTIAGVPVGAEIEAEAIAPPARDADAGSIIVVLATDAPLLPYQCRALARRAGMGLARLGSIAALSSGDLFLAFSTANPPGGADLRENIAVTQLGLNRLSALYEAAVQATEEAIVNALVAARPMTGIDGRTVPALDHADLRRILARHRRLLPPQTTSTAPP